MSIAKQPTISAIVVSWNVCDALARCLAALRTSEGVSFEIIVVDNASADGTKEFLEGQTDVRSISNTRNVGFATAVDQGVKHARGQMCILVNPDVTVYPDTLAHAVAAVQTHSHAGVIGGKIMNANGTVQHSVHRFPTFWDQAITLAKFATPLASTRVMQRYRASTFAYDVAAEVEQVEGALFAFTRHTYESLGGFDTRYHLWFEEVDFCKRCRDAGKKIWYDPRFCAVHSGGLSTRQLSPLRRHLWYQRSMLRYFRKFHAPQHLFLLPFAVFGTLVAIVATIMPRKVFRRFIRPSYASK